MGKIQDAIAVVRTSVGDSNNNRTAVARIGDPDPAT